MRSAAITYVDRLQVVELARELARDARQKHPEIERAVLIGSFACGKGGPRSDIDMVLVVRETELAPRDRVAFYLPVCARPVDLVVYTREEVEQMRDDPPPILREALTVGIDLL